jgi:hypothetical protein
LLEPIITLAEETLMQKRTDNGSSQLEIAILTRILGNGKDKLPAPMARYILTLRFGEQDKSRMHELVVRNQDDALTPSEKDELSAYAKAGSVLSILKSKARRVLAMVSDV